ncbi:MAG TPA: septum formation initiator family protein [Solirubrobacteraceae bacterium]
MASARATTPSRRSTGRPAAHGRRAAPARIRWDRLGRVAMLFVLLVLLYLYISPVRSLIAAFHQSAAQRSDVASLEQTTSRLLAERSALKQSSTLELDARKQGLVKPGEKEFVVFGLPPN